MHHVADPIPHLRRWITTAGLPRPGETVLCAVSGGADSIALARAMAGLATHFGFLVALAHCNHHLRGAESDRDEEMAAEIARELGTPFLAMDASLGPTAGRSIEACARRARREALLQAASQLGAKRVALGHTLDDQAETVLFRAAKGTSIAGLAAMREVDASGTWLRPFLRLRREDLRAWLRREGFAWREDRSNRETRFARNRVRGEILPLLAARLSPRAPIALAALAADAAEADAFLEQHARAAWRACRAGTPASPDRSSDPLPAEIRLVRAAVRSYDGIIRKRVLRTAFLRAGGDPARLSRDHLEGLDRLIHDGTGSLDLPGHFWAAVDPSGSLIIGRARKPGSLHHPLQGCEGESAALPLAPGALELPWAGVRIDASLRDRTPADRPEAADGRQVAVFDADRIREPLRIRNWRRADRFQPFGMQGRQKLSDFFVNEKVPRADRAKIPLLMDGDGILWVAGFRRSARAEVTPATRRLLEVRVRELSGAAL